MRFLHWTVLFSLVVAEARGQSLWSRMRKAVVRSRNFPQMLTDVYLEIVGRTGESKRNPANTSGRNFLQVARSNDMFPCDTCGFRSPTPPSNVHKLRPGDIDIIAAMGDSITAGNGIAATNVLEVTVENRGIACTIGGQGSWREYITLPNILKRFNSKLVGFSLGDSYWYSPDSQFNVAFGGAGDDDLMAQAKALYRRMKAYKGIDFKKQWKLVTMLSGNNDICTNICFEDILDSAVEKHRKRLQEVLDYMKKRFPRTFVNLISVPDHLLLTRIIGKPFTCEMMHRFECSCLFSQRGEALRKVYENIIHGYQQVEKQLANSGRYDTSDDFTVVYQPFPSNTSIPIIVTPNGWKSDLSYMSQDCFHLSQKGHARCARALWRNMLQPVGNKSVSWENLPNGLTCPTEEFPYLFTSKNSRTFSTKR